MLDEGVLEVFVSLVSYVILPFPARLVAETIKLVRRRVCGIVFECRILCEKVVERRRCETLALALFLGNVWRQTLVHETDFGLACVIDGVRVAEGP